MAPQVGWHVWLLALGLSLVTVVIDEYFKFRMRDNDESRRRWRLVEGSFEVRGQHSACRDRDLTWANRHISPSVSCLSIRSFCRQCALCART